MSDTARRADGMAELLNRARVIDLTHTLTPEFPLFPIYDPVRVADKLVIERDGFFVRSWSFDEHSGTHVDAPAHADPQGATIDLIDPADLVLRAAVIDIRDRVARDHDATIDLDDLAAWERRHGPLPTRGAVLALTGWGERVAERSRYLNQDADGVIHSPGFSREATEFIVEERPGVRAIGIDTGSLDIGASDDFPAHRSWLPTGRYGIENVANLERLPPDGAVVVVGAPALQGGSGGPTRLLAFAP